MSVAWPGLLKAGVRGLAEAQPFASHARIAVSLFEVLTTALRHCETEGTPSTLLEKLTSSTARALSAGQVAVTLAALSLLRSLPKPLTPSLTSSTPLWKAMTTLTWEPGRVATETLAVAAALAHCMPETVRLALQTSCESAISASDLDGNCLIIVHHGIPNPFVSA